VAPFLKMTLPRSFQGKSVGDVSPGTHIGKSLLVLFGMIPFGYDDITVAQIEFGRMFREESAMIGMRTWIHERTLEPVDGKTVVTDAITLIPRLALPGLTRFLAATLAAFFAHRHRRLRGRFAAD
jgi:ligand-binding SRPBCC domain-containing protein